MAKKKNLFTHLQQITAWKNNNYWEKLTEGEKKSYSPFMINRFLSMETGKHGLPMTYIELVNEVQMYQLTRKQSYDVYMELLPQEKIWNKYLKGKKDSNKKDAEVLADHFGISEREANYYIDVLMATGRKSEIKEIKKLYGEKYNE